MKKLTLVLVGLVMMLSMAVCSAQEVSDWKTLLPKTYVSQDLKAVRAEPACIAMYVDSEGKLPELWVYEEKLDGKSLKEHMIKKDSVRDYKVLWVDQKTAYTFYYENWYGRQLINEELSRINNETGTVILFDFAYDDIKEEEYLNAQHGYVVELAKLLKFDTERNIKNSKAQNIEGVK